MGIAILKAGRVIVALKGATAAEMADHIRNGYPQHIPDIEVLTADEYPDDALPALSPPTPEEIEAKDAEKLQNAFLKAIIADRFELENRVRVLEGKVSITETQYRTAVRAILGL